MKPNKYTYYLQELQDVQLVMNTRIFIYLDLLLLSCFLFFILYAQTYQWNHAFMISFCFLVATTAVFTLLCFLEGENTDSENKLKKD
ncbi:hypothetical protein IEO70_16110 [Bacillus sp. AGMB 02131]|uniref:Uncharacterized protein n=1 Tax=Peribacillus faecalis TaxID=2772559 RepID=A0A927HBL1_9BACI|nr:hypothetical protein [Peribacillus faecalis]MBD3109865.1 hypothetical protein [Peribacillus faecalis]